MAQHGIVMPDPLWDRSQDRSPDPAADLPAYLRRETRGLHARLDRLVELPGSIRSRSDLAFLVGLLLDVHSTLEPALERVDGWAAIGIDLQLRGKRQWLTEDLKTLDASRPPAEVRAPALPDLATAAGALYVMEGATLGGGVMAPMIEDRFELAPGEGTRFLRNYGTGRRARWEACRSALRRLDAASQNHAIRTRAARGARATFHVYINHLGEHWGSR